MGKQSSGRAQLPSDAVMSGILRNSFGGEATNTIVTKPESTKKAGPQHDFTSYQRGDI